MQSTTQQQGGQLKRTMKTRHLIMLSLGGVIGTGLFFNTGYILSLIHISEPTRPY